MGEGAVMTPTTYIPIVKALCAQYGIPNPSAEVRFAPPRRWRLDFGWGKAKVALEVQGGIWTAGRHSRGSGLLKEYEKMNAAAARGWRVCYCTPQTLITGVEAVAKCLTQPEK